MSEISLILVLQNKNKQNSEWHGKNTNKIRKTHSFFGIFSIMEQLNEFCRFASKIPLTPIGCGFEVILSDHLLLALVNVDASL